METQGKFVEIAHEELTYDQYLQILENAYRKNRMVPRGNIIFPIPESYSEYDIMYEIKAKIAYLLFQQYSHYRTSIKQVAMWSLDINENSKRLTSWESLDASEYTLVLGENDFSQKEWSTTYVRKGSSKAQENFSPDLILFFEKNNKTHTRAVDEILQFENQELIYEKCDNLELIQITIPVQRLLGIAW